MMFIKNWEGKNAKTHNSWHANRAQISPAREIINKKKIFIFLNNNIKVTVILLIYIIKLSLLILKNLVLNIINISSK
jgi:hypothetical protein